MNINSEAPEQGREPPIHLKQRHLACENTVFSVFLDHVMGANSQEVLQYLSIIPKSRTEDSVTGVCVLPVKGGKYGLIQMFRHPLQRWSWEMPRGMIDAGETASAAVLRELREETGFSLHPSEITEMGVAAPAASLVAGRVKIFVAMISPETEPGSIHKELGLGETRFFSRSEIAEMISSGEIEDACTLSAFLMHAIQQGCWAEKVAET